MLENLWISFGAGCLSGVVIFAVQGMSSVVWLAAVLSFIFVLVYTMWIDR